MSAETVKTEVRHAVMPSTDDIALIDRVIALGRSVGVFDQATTQKLVEFRERLDGKEEAR